MPLIVNSPFSVKPKKEMVKAVAEFQKQNPTVTSIGTVINLLVEKGWQSVKDKVVQTHKIN